MAALWLGCHVGGRLVWLLHTHTSTNTVCMYIHTYIHAHINIHIYKHYTHTHIYICMYTNTYIHIYTDHFLLGPRRRPASRERLELVDEAMGQHVAAVLTQEQRRVERLLPRRLAHLWEGGGGDWGLGYMYMYMYAYGNFTGTDGRRHVHTHCILCDIDTKYTPT